MATAGGPDIERDGLVFGMDTGYGVANNNTATRFYPGETTENLITANGLDFTQMSTYGNLTRTQVVDINSPSGYACEMQVTDGAAINTAARIAFGANTNIPSNGNAMVSVYIKFEGGSSSNITPKVYNGSGTAWQTLAPLDGGSAYLTNEYRRFGYYGSITANPGFSMTKENSSIQTGQKTRWHSPQVELTTHATPLVSGSRSDTESLIDLTKTTDIDVSNVSFDSTGQPTFDGTDDYINLGDDSRFDFTNGIMTVEAVIKFPSSWTGGSQYPNLISKGASAGWDTNGWSLFGFRDWPSAGQKSWGLGFRNGATSRTVNKANSTVDVYLHIVATVDGSTMRLYENGVQVSTQSQTINPASNSTNVYIGRDPSSQYFPGDIPTTKLYDRALSADEVQQNYNAYKNRFNL